MIIKKADQEINQGPLFRSFVRLNKAKLTGAVVATDRMVIKIISGDFLVCIRQIDIFASD